MRKKKVVVEQIETNHWVDPNPDPYGKSELIARIEKMGVLADIVGGVVIVHVAKENYDKVLNSIKELVSKQGYPGSWGVSVIQPSKNMVRNILFDN